MAVFRRMMEADPTMEAAETDGARIETAVSDRGLTRRVSGCFLIEAAPAGRGRHPSSASGQQRGSFCVASATSIVCSASRLTASSGAKNSSSN